MKYKDGKPIGNTALKLKNQQKAVERLKKFSQNPEYELVQTSLSHGSCPRSTGGYEEPYSGRYGEGWKVHIPLWSADNKLHKIYYYVKKNT